jgi:hypothetical protein
MTSKRVSEKNLAVSPGAGKPPSTRKAATSKRPARSKASPDSSISSTMQTPVTGVATGVEAPREPIAAEAIAALAYSYWVARGCADGSPEEDWIRAERELRGSPAIVVVGKATA